MACQSPFWCARSLDPRDRLSIRKLAPVRRQGGSGSEQTRQLTSTADLFGKPTFLALLPGETLSSLISRHHYFWGNALASKTCNQFFGHKRVGSQHDFPSHLGNFVARTDGCFGSTDALTKARTLLSFYRAFLPIDICESAQASMSGSSVAHLKLRLGILTSRFRANHPLKACESCMEEDCADLGWAYWCVFQRIPPPIPIQSRPVTPIQTRQPSIQSRPMNWPAHWPIETVWWTTPLNFSDGLLCKDPSYEKLDMRRHARPFVPSGLMS